MRRPATTSARRRTAAVAVACGLLAAGCSTAGGQDHAPDAAPAPTTSEAPLIPAPTRLPKVDVADVLPKEMSDLAAQAERIAGRLPPQTRPAAVDVAAGTTRWQVGATYRGVFGDPDIVADHGTWFAYGTNTAGNALPTLSSRDLVRWVPVGNALPHVGDWVARRTGGHGLWAPSVARIAGGWTAAYAAPESTIEGARHNCIGLARARSPRGPFAPVGGPICYDSSRLGVIDPDLYVDDRGTGWLLWKFSGIAGQRPAGIFVRRLDSDGTAFAEGSETHEILRRALAWEGRTIENPSMVEFRGVTYLFYSGNSWRTPGYGTGYAICAGPSGPCARPGDGAPLLTTASTGNIGPGGASGFVRGDSLQLIYHAWEPGRVGQLRRIHVAGLWQRPDGTLQVVDPG
ncbi:MAG TPA: glycoside hydrolase family 43 protein [Nocardioides sp.]|nr:glycoside hydrolase family 43 protein [Nocardioides sp.]